MKCRNMDSMEKVKMAEDINTDYSKLNDQEMPNMTPLQPINTTSMSPVSIEKPRLSKERLNSTIHELSRDGAIESVRSVLDSFVTESGRSRVANSKDEKGTTALHYAAKHNHVDVAELLIRFGANVNAKGKGGRTPLHYASRFRPTEEQTTIKEHQEDNRCENACPKIVPLLIRNGASLSERDFDGRTPLHLAVIMDNEPVVDHLLQEKSLNLEIKDDLGNTALQIAVSNRKTQMLKKLIEAGANVRIADRIGSTPLHICCSDDDGLQIAKIFIDAIKQKHGKVVVQELLRGVDAEGNTCLILAVNNGRYEMAKLLVKNGADVNTFNSAQMYPLHLAALNGDTRIVKMLLKNDAQIDVLNKEKLTPLCKAIQFNHSEVIVLLIKKGADIEKTVKKRQYTPLLLACCTGYCGIVDMLIKGKADVSAVDDNGKTCIYLATERNHFASLQVLLEHENVRELVNEPDEDNNTPLHVAAENGFLDCLQLLLKKHADPNSKNSGKRTPLHIAAQHGRKEVVKPLVFCGGQLRAKDKDSNTPLHLAALHGHAETALFLIEQGADLETENRNSWTPLCCTAAKGWTKTARVLLEAEASVDVSNKTGAAPLHLAAKHGHADIIELLLRWGADIRQGDRDRNNCLDIAIENHKSKAAIAILKSANWKDALRNLTISHAVMETPMRKLIKEMPDVAKLVLDKCTYMENLFKPDLYEHERGITFNYEFVDDGYFIEYWLRTKNDGTKPNTVRLFDYGGKLKDEAVLYSSDYEMVKKNHPLTIMVSAKRETLLQHPLITALLQRKWQSWTNRFFYINYMMYIVFLVFLTGYLVSTTPPYVENASVSALTSNSSYCGKLNTSGYNQPIFANIGKYIVTLLACWNLLREIFQMSQAKLSYLSWENLIELVTYICAILFVNDFEECQKSTGYRHVWQWNAGTIAVLLAWINLVLFSQKFLFGLYVVMLKDILSTFLRFFLLFMLLIVGFALAFFATLQNQNSFATVWQSLVKTTVMMIGEFEYDSIYTEGEVNSQVIGYLLFYVFMILMTIIVMNLMVGLAVDNIKGIQDQAELTRRGMQIELALDIEALWPDFVRRKFVCLEETIVPQFGKPSILQRIRGILGTKGFELTADSIKNNIDPAPTEVDGLRETVSDMERDLKEIKDTLADLKDVKNALTDLKQVKDMLTLLVRDRGNET